MADFPHVCYVQLAHLDGPTPLGLLTLGGRRMKQVPGLPGGCIGTSHTHRWRGGGGGLSMRVG